MLIEYKADIKLLNSFGKSAAEEAYDRNFIEISEYIIEKDSDDSKNSIIFEESINDKQMEEEFKDSDIMYKIKCVDDVDFFDNDCKNELNNEKNENGEIDSKNDEDDYTCDLNNLDINKENEQNQ